MREAANRRRKDISHFNARARGITRRLRDAGFLPLRNIAGEDEPPVWLACAPENLITEALRLHEIVMTWHIPAYNVAYADDGIEICGVGGFYHPSEHDAGLVVWGIDDEMLSQCPRPDSTTRSIVAAPQLAPRELDLAAPVRHTPEPAWEKFDPCCHAVVRHFVEAGCLVVGAEPDEDCTTICLECPPEQLVSETRRLHARVRSWGAPEASPAPDVSAAYHPKWHRARVTLTGIANSMLAEIPS